MAKRTIAVATWEYLVKGGKRRRGYFGDVVDLSPAEIKRGEAAGALASAKRPQSPAPSPDEGTLPPADESTVDTGTSTGEGDASAGDGDDDVLSGLDTDADGDNATGDAPADGDEPAAVARPKLTAPHAEWIEFAVAQGMDRAEAEGTDRADLVKALS
ncbi:hypothetical protein [Gordonia malaquae]|uniref:hypothetical protein n=1 Tax=Gordonia malaquae TaxID=410332 RepID=UPI00301ADD19